MGKPNIIVRMGAAAWDMRVRRSDGSYVLFDIRGMERKERSVLHRELMNAYRASRSAAA